MERPHDESLLPSGEELADSLDVFLRNGGRFDQSAEADSREQDNNFIEIYGMLFLLKCFPVLPDEETGKWAQTFRKFVLACKEDPDLLSRFLGVSSRESERVARQISLEGLAELASEKFERVQKRADAAIAGSGLELMYRRGAFYWLRVGEIVRAAC